MGRTNGGGWWVIALLGCVVPARAGHAQELAPPPQPVSGGSAQVAEVSQSTPPPPAPCSCCLAPAACAPFEDRNGPLLQGDSLLDRPGTPPPGWFIAKELDFVAPSITNHVTNNVSIGGIGVDTVHLPTATLNWAVMPRVEGGYRFSEGAGVVLASYYGLTTSGNATLLGYDPAGAGYLHSRLETNVVDLDYGNYEYFLGSKWLLFWKVGGRLSQAYFDSLATGAILEQRTSDFFLGAGPHVGFDLRRSLNVPGLQFFGRCEGGGNVGRLTQNFEETFAIAGVPVVGGATKVSVIQWVPNLRFMAGLAWNPWQQKPLTFSGGYIFEDWWYLGEARGSNASLSLNGIFLRLECKY